MLIDCEVKDCLTMCSSINGILPQISDAAELTETETMLAKYSETNQVLELEQRDGALFHTQTLRRFKFMDTLKFPYFAALPNTQGVTSIDYMIDEQVGKK